MNDDDPCPPYYNSDVGYMLIFPQFGPIVSEKKVLM
jgi:hypothetical protein